MNLQDAISTLIAHASGDNPPDEITAAIEALKPLLDGAERARLDSFGPFTTIAEFIAVARSWRPDDVADWITHGAQLEAISCWEDHIHEGWRMNHLCDADLAPAIGQLIAWHDHLRKIPGGNLP